MESVSNDREILVLTGVLIALALWFAVTGGPDGEPAGAREAPRVYAEAPVFKSNAGTFDYVPDGAEALKIPPSVPATSEASTPAPEPAVPPDTAAAAVPPPAQTASIEAHALMADPLFDPLGAAVLAGLPGDARLSAGARISPEGAERSDWAVAFGDLDDLIVHLPHDQAAPIRARLDLRTRGGVLITSLNVEVRQDALQTASPKVSPLAARPGAKTAKTPRAGDKMQDKDKEKAQRVTAKPPAGRPGPVKSAAAVSRPPPPGVGPAGPPAVVTLPPPPVPILFKPDPKDSSLSGLSPTLRDDPRFMTLRGLGMAPPEPSSDEPLPLLPVMP